MGTSPMRDRAIWRLVMARPAIRANHATGGKLTIQPAIRELTSAPTSFFPFGAFPFRVVWGIHTSKFFVMMVLAESQDHDLLPLDLTIQRKVVDLAIHHERFVNY
jgi:hypothetical protein